MAEWISLTEMKDLQSACMLVSMKVREKEHEEFLSYQGDQVWNELSEECQQYLTDEEESPAVWSKMCSTVRPIVAAIPGIKSKEI